MAQQKIVRLDSMKIRVAASICVRAMSDCSMISSHEVFLIAAAIEAYNQSKSRDVGDYNLASPWKRYGRAKAMRN